MKRISYLTCDDIDTLIPPCASRFTNDERRRSRSDESAMAAEAFMDLAGLNALTAYQRCVIPTASPTDKALRHNSLVTHIAL